MPINEEEKKRIIDLYFNQGKNIREVCKMMGKSSHDVTPVIKEHGIRLAQNYAPVNGEQNDDARHEHDSVISNVKAYKLFNEGKSPLEVTAELNLPGPQVQQFYAEYLNLRQMHNLVAIYQENKDSIGYFLKLVRLGKKEGLTPEQIMIFIKMADSIHRLKEKLQHIQSEVLDIAMRKSVSKEELKDLHDEIETAQEKLTSVDEAFNVKYEELKEVCSQAKKLQNYVEQFKNGQDYKELEAIARSEVGKILLDNKKLLQNALVSVIVALRNDPDKYLLIDKMELTPFTTTTIINYNSFLALRRPSRPQGDEQFVSGRVLEMAERVLNNLQKGIVDSTISIAAGLEKGSLYSGTYQALPYYEFLSHLPRYFNQNSMETNENSNNGDEVARIAYNDGYYIRR
jgi:transposase-like protein